MGIKDSFLEIFGNKNRVLVVLGHPDDNEIICGGIVARLLAEGKKVRSVAMTNGGKGFQNRTDVTEIEFSKIRKTEQIEAGKELGLTESDIFNIDIPDGELETTVENIGKVVFHIRQFKPDIVITQNPFDTINTFDADTHWVNHRDHRHVALITIDAVYPYSRDRGFFPEHFTEHNLEPHTVSEILFSDAYSYPDVRYFDVTKYIDKKKNALLKHKNAFTSEDIEEEFLEETRLEAGKNFERLKYLKV
ncbi:MAG: PIG-L deacetylase family protein [Patescibacteria group bacterium]